MTSYVTDALGSTVALTNASGSTTASYSYEPYGASIKVGSDDSPIQFTGRENDGPSNLLYYRARYYSSRLNRFISEDPIGLLEGINVYAYVHGDPVSYSDRSGLLVGGRVNAGEAYGDSAAQYWADLATQSDLWAKTEPR